MLNASEFKAVPAYLMMGLRVPSEECPTNCSISPGDFNGTMSSKGTYPWGATMLILVMETLYGETASCLGYSGMCSNYCQPFHY